MIARELEGKMSDLKTIITKYGDDVYRSRKDNLGSKTLDILVEILCHVDDILDQVEMLKKLETTNEPEKVEGVSREMKDEYTTLLVTIDEALHSGDDEVIKKAIEDIDNYTKKVYKKVL